MTCCRGGRNVGLPVGAAAVGVRVDRVPYADAMCLAIPAGSDPVALASISDNVVDGLEIGG
jgi:hypothetical protein